MLSDLVILEMKNLQMDGEVVGVKKLKKLKNLTTVSHRTRAEGTSRV
jgi:hypothetical protein